MTILEEKMREMLTLYEKLNNRYKLELRSAPEGKLIYQMNGNYRQFLQSFQVDGDRIRRGINSNEQLIRDLARKEFNQKAAEVLEHDIEVIRDALAKQIPFDPDDILASMTKAYAFLPEDYFFDRRTLISDHDLDESDLIRISRNREWGNAPYKESWFHPERKTKRTSRGTYVRSKSELLIIEKLYDYNIPVHYDEEHVINGVFVVPDFTFKDRKREFFFWDFMGMMDDPDYARRNIAKQEDYYKAGLIPGDNLILTFAKGDSINMGMIDAIILNEIIPRL